ncbi:MAG: outer membrane lipoprotein-sorting protein [Desulfofustis sp.]|nr:outer membrane lipoprotein-sorting protein [Desulfofustis sp.]
MRRIAGASLIIFLMFCSKLQAADTEALVLVQKAFDYWRGMSSYSEFSMTIHRPDFERTMVLKGWTKGRSDALFFVLQPPKDAGNGSLKKGKDMWSYNPKINRAIKLPPSMMSQSWMGSDFSNDDLAKTDSILQDYDHRIIAREMMDGHQVYTVESIAREDAPVVWGKQVLRIRDDFILLSEKFFDEDMELVKQMTAEDLVTFAERIFPKTWIMRRVDESDRFTRLEYQYLEFDLEIEDRVFTLASLKSKKRLR